MTCFCVPKTHFGEVYNDKGDTSGSNTHDFALNGQVERKINHARKMPMKVELNEEMINIKPNSGTFKAIYEKK